ncbi:hypothetical protein ZWY2020_008405 [Hordeum vulgare]|nr:hypothetical protein ZWY2020_008405 [Hordeum vulgare]
MASAAATSTPLRLLSSPLSKPLLPRPHLLALSCPISFQRLTARSAASLTPSTSSSSAASLTGKAPARPGHHRFPNCAQRSAPAKQPRHAAAYRHGTGAKIDANHRRGRLPGRVHATLEAEAPAALCRLRRSSPRSRQVARARPLRRCRQDAAMVPVEFNEMLGIDEPRRFGGHVHESSEPERPQEEEFEDEPAAVVQGNGSLGGGRKERIRDKLERGLSLVELKIEDISHQHKGHAVVAGSYGETHFNVLVVSREFEGKSMLKRHRVAYDLLQDELKSGLHALSIDAKTPSEV